MCRQCEELKKMAYKDGKQGYFCLCQDDESSGDWIPVDYEKLCAEYPETEFEQLKLKIARIKKTLSVRCNNSLDVYTAVDIISDVYKIVYSEIYEVNNVKN